MKLTIETAITQMTQMIRSTFPDESIAFDLVLNVENNTRGKVYQVTASNSGFSIVEDDIQLATINNFEYEKPFVLRGLAQKLHYTIEPDIESNQVEFIGNENVFISQSGFITGLVNGEHTIQVVINGKTFDIEVNVYEPTEELYTDYIEHNDMTQV